MLLCNLNDVCILFNFQVEEVSNAMTDAPTEAFENHDDDAIAMSDDKDRQVIAVGDGNVSA